MCGILGISSSSSKKYDILSKLSVIRHRGPDDIGFYSPVNRKIQLGQVRLSILDVTSAGHQPMFDAKNRYAMVYNGEIYNFLELKIYLENKYGLIEWKSSSDSEVIIEGFAREKESFFEKLNGIFSILIYDLDEDLLHVIRDPLGVKPLYQCTQDGDVFFCSELKGLLAFDSLRRSLRFQSMTDQLSYMYVPEPYTMYNEFFKVERGVHFTYRSGQKISETQMFSFLHGGNLHADENDLINLFKTTFHKAVKRQSVSDVPMSLFLSGGLDSSAVAIESVTSGAQVKSAYTISFSKGDLRLDGQSEDLYFAEKVAKQLNLNLNVIEAKEDFMDLLIDLVPYMEDGISDPAAINTYLICKYARESGVKVMLSGQGADEYLCGYRRYVAEKYLENMPLLMKKLIVASNKFVPNNLPGFLNPISRRFKKLAFASDQNEIDRLKGYFMWGTPSQVRKLFLNKEIVNPGWNLDVFFTANSQLSNLEKLLAADQEFDLLALNLAYSDKMSMMVGVETRVPFLDFELVKLMNSLPLNLKLKGYTQKYILKKAMEGKLPNEVIYRSKAGFSLPIRSWFQQKNNLVEFYFNRERISRQGIFDADELDKLYKQQLSGGKDNSYILFSMLCLLIWLDKNV
jgi:asparagine synthase (glutamine-hydrolysing)